MIEAFMMGGWGMWFILVFGVLAITASARFVLRGDVGLAAFARWMCLTTGISAVFGFLTGMIKVFDFVAAKAPPDERWVILVLGTGEATHCLTFGALLATLTTLLLAVGYRRFPPAEARSAA